jgi:DNA processing protein
MTPDDAIALSLLDDLSRYTLIDRLRAGDPELAERAALLRSKAGEIRDRAAECGIFALAWNDPRFPPQLLAIADCPPALWYRGAIDTLDAPLVAIVGSRAATAVALETATRLAAGLAARGVVVVSGLARGVDSAAHRGALHHDGRTVAVLGSGVDVIYPPEHADLAAEIASDGVIVSEYPPETPPLPFHFPLRNRIISGLSRAIVVIEASEKSGSLITASWALQQGRDVMAVPGNVLSGRNRGGHALIRDGAKIVESADDIVTELGFGSTDAGRTSQDATAVCVDSLLAIMDVGSGWELDGLAAASGLDAGHLLPRLAELELRGLIRRDAAGRFIRSV